MVFRGRDVHLLAVLAFYRTIVVDLQHQAAVDQTMQDIREWQEANPTKLKEPGISGDFKLFMKDEDRAREPGVAYRLKADRKQQVHTDTYPYILYVEKSLDDTVSAHWSDGQINSIKVSGSIPDYIRELLEQARFPSV